MYLNLYCGFGYAYVGVLTERVPLAVLIAPVLSRESIRNLTQGTIYEKQVLGENDEEPRKIEPERYFKTEKLTQTMMAMVK